MTRSRETTFCSEFWISPIFSSDRPERLRAPVAGSTRFTPHSSPPSVHSSSLRVRHACKTL